MDKQTLEGLGEGTRKALKETKESVKTRRENEGKEGESEKRERARRQKSEGLRLEATLGQIVQEALPKKKNHKRG
jgi:hypothetical protein